MGGSLAAHAARAGHEVTVIDVSPDVLARIRAHGLTISAPEGQFTQLVAATDDPVTAGQADLVVIFVKAQHTEAAGASMQPLVGPETTVLTLQNGWGNADVVAQFIPPEQLVVGVTYNSCTAAGPGQILHSGRGPTVVGPYRGGDLRHAERAAGLLRASGWETTVSDAVLTEIWKKLVLNSATLPPAALSRLSAGELGKSPELRRLVDGLAAETVAVAVAQGLDIDLDERITAIHGVLERAGDGKPSMLQDVLSGRKTEVEMVNGAVVSAAARHNVAVPLNTAMVAVVHGLERSYLQ